jgi:hypothetical protein
MVEGMGFRSFGFKQNVTVPGGVAGVLFASPKAPVANYGEMRVSITTLTAATIFYIMNDGINGNKLITLGTTVADVISTFKFAFRNNCTYDIVAFNNYAPVTVIDLDVEEVEIAVGF